MEGRPSSALEASPSEKSSSQKLTQIIESLNNKIVEFEQNNRRRFAQEAKLQLAKIYIQQEAWEDALRVLRPLWQNMTYRNEGWWDITEEICWELRRVAAQTGDGGTLVAVDWELMNDSM